VSNRFPEDSDAQRISKQPRQ